MVQAHIIYSGIVHGVGFRFTAQRFAEELGINGWVRNLSDGRVEITIESSKENAQEFIKRLDNHFSRYIKSKEVSFSSSQGTFLEFLIKPTV